VSVEPALTPSELGSVVLHEPIPARSGVANSLPYVASHRRRRRQDAAEVRTRQKRDLRRDAEHVDARELLEEKALAFDHRLGGEQANVAEAGNGIGVGHDRAFYAPTLVRIVTNSSAIVGWIPTVASNWAFVALHLIATAKPWRSSPASSPII